MPDEQRELEEGRILHSSNSLFSGTNPSGAVYSSKSSRLEARMFSRIRISLGPVLLLALVFAAPVFAGGWAVISLDELPTGVVAGEPVTVGFTVLQHGITPMSGLEPTVTATLLKDEQFTAFAKPDGKPGHYTATLVFPKEGEWRWSIQAFSMDQLMPMLTVAPAVTGVVAQSEPVQSSGLSVVWIVRALALGLGVIGLVVAMRRKSRLAYALTALCLLVGVGSFVAGAGLSVGAEAQADAPVQKANEESVSQVELGRQLFVAKGCVTCHVNRKIGNDSEYWTIGMGAPDLTKFSASEEVLRIRLKDPAAAKSDTKMPNLGLKEYEIEALIAFINSK
jgi:mono/diheme cytochrome c family protein